MLTKSTGLIYQFTYLNVSLDKCNGAIGVKALCQPPSEAAEADDWSENQPEPYEDIHFFDEPIILNVKSVFRRYENSHVNHEDTLECVGHQMPTLLPHSDIAVGHLKFRGSEIKKTQNRLYASPHIRQPPIPRPDNSSIRRPINRPKMALLPANILYPHKYSTPNIRSIQRDRKQ